jgi:hypothetical protein
MDEKLRNAQQLVFEGVERGQVNADLAMEHEDRYWQWVEAMEAQYGPENQGGGL